MTILVHPQRLHRYWKYIGYLLATRDRPGRSDRLAKSDRFEGMDEDHSNTTLVVCSARFYTVFSLFFLFLILLVARLEEEDSSIINPKKMNSNNILPTILIAMAVSSLFTYLLTGCRTPNNSATSSRDTIPSAFYLGVAVIFPTVQEKESFKTLFRPMAQFVKDHEPGTLSYELLESDKEPERILILERYVNKDYYLNVHRTSKEFLSFRAEFQKMIEKGVKVDGHSYLEPGIGFV